jgi:hypothetical protein
MSNLEPGESETQTEGLEWSKSDLIVESAKSKKVPSILKKIFTRKFVFIMSSVLFVLLVFGVGYYIGNGHKKTPTVSQSASNVKTGTAQSVSNVKTGTAEPTIVENLATLDTFSHPKTGEVWHETPKPMNKQGWLTAELPGTYQDIVSPGSPTVTVAQQMAENAPTYEEIGTHGGSKIVRVYTTPSMGQFFGLFEIRSSGKVYAIAQPNASGKLYDGQADNLNQATTNKVSAVDTTTHYDSLSIPPRLDIGNDEYVAPPEYSTILSGVYDPESSVANQKDSKQFGSSVLYRTEHVYADTGLTNIGYTLKLPTGTWVTMTYTPNTLSLEKYSFSNGAPVSYTDYEGRERAESLGPIARGCGDDSVVVTRSERLSDGDLVAVGKTDTGRTVYGLASQNAFLISKAYDEYKQALDGSVQKVDSLETFYERHGVVIIKNAKGENLVYIREHYSMGGGCAKPVVYLYPASAQMVSVRVGANVTISDPQYETNGWQGVWAEPSGNLTYRGQAYSSLFWEGQGQGEYPAISNGTVVKRADAATTMRRQLVDQGLNQKEITDFMAFWESKIPAKPYVRLTWLNTAQMDRLAPLVISPKPQTVIRVFLDMDGFDTPISLPKQKLIKVERKGFTVVEWGGLTHSAHPAGL